MTRLNKQVGIKWSICCICMKSYFVAPQLSELEGRCQSREAEFESYCRQLQNKPESRLQAEISMLSLEKVYIPSGGR